ncbi:MAG: thiamine pyrophosphate-dependent dehydrogenase E1 component subunit alpha [Victivallales bacterium]|nr:thiamine pyrophosphate-dependent dehydrogenase E1 component subunit alpha [Victivallales bacterium]
MDSYREESEMLGISANAADRKSLEDYALMLLIRFFEETVEMLFVKGYLTGTVHTCSGQEASAVGVVSALRKGDLVTSNHRGHGHFMAKGGDPGRIMAEIFGKAEGYSGGRGGSQLMADYSLGFMGGNGIVCGSVAVATGMGLRLKMRGSGNIAACFIGDGALNQGIFYESLNMAALWRLPVIYICENNLYSMSTPVHKAHSQPDFVVKAEAMGASGASCDGNDYFAVRDLTSRLAAKARDGGGPVFIELKTYRFSGHSRGDKRIYRTREEEKMWKRKDPLKVMRQKLEAAGLLDPKSDKELRAMARKKVGDAVRFAKKSPFPDTSTLMGGLFA